MSAWDRFVETFFNGKVMLKYLPDILSGVVVTIELAVLIVISGLLAGLVLALLRSLAIRPINWLIIFVVDLFRSLPPLVIIVLIYFGGPAAGLSPSGFVSTWLSLALVLMAFSEEIFWAGITSVHKGQWEAARSTGLGFGRTLLNVVLPQALRLTIPPLTNRTIAITKGTALGTVVAVTEILGEASSAVSNSYNPSPLMMGAAAYLVLFLPVVVAARSAGLSRLQAMGHIVLPQAVRNVLPDLLSNTLEVVKLTSLGSVVAVPELLYQARQAQSLTYNPTPIVVAAIIYFLMLWPLVRLLSRLENRALAGRH